MLSQPTIEKLYAMRMRGMADAFTQQQEDPQTTQRSFEERFRCWWTASGAGGRTGHWRGVSKRAVYKVQPAWKISTSARHGVWTSR